jgi:hypothetical protein
MKLRFYLDPETGEVHISKHGVEEEEVQQVLTSSVERYPGDGGALIVMGQTRTGRWLKVVLSLDPAPDSAFVITAFDPTHKELRALRRRLKKRMS